MSHQPLGLSSWESCITDIKYKVGYTIQKFKSNYVVIVLVILMSLGRVHVPVLCSLETEGFLKEISCQPGKYQLQPTPGVLSVHLYSPTETLN